MKLLDRRTSILLLALVVSAFAACSSSDTTSSPTVAATALPTSSATATGQTPDLASPTATTTSLPATTSPTPGSVPSPTAVPTNTVLPSTPSPTRPPTATSTPAPDPRYNLIVTSDRQRAFDVFGSEIFIDYTNDISNVPVGSRKVLYINNVTPPPFDRIAEVAEQAPGSVWYVLGEPNAHGVTVDDALVGLHDTYTAIKSADPTALITSPSILNFSFNCINCGGYEFGATWITNFYFGYIDLFGEEPPIDIWAIDVFPIVWPSSGLSTDEAFPTVRDDIITKQIVEFREWVDSRPETKGDPIWITEFGLHWGFEDWEFGVSGCGENPTPVGEYLTDEVIAYLTRVYTWLENNSSALNVQRWFTFTTYRYIAGCQPDSGNGLSLLTSTGSNGELTEVGEFYNNWIRGIR